MSVKEQKQIKFINDCNAIVDYIELEKAILWCAKNPVTSIKHIYMHGKYPAVSISREKIQDSQIEEVMWNMLTLNNYTIKDITLTKSLKNLVVIGQQ